MAQAGAVNHCHTLIQFSGLNELTGQVVDISTCLTACSVNHEVIACNAHVSLVGLQVLNAVNFALINLNHIVGAFELNVDVACTTLQALRQRFCGNLDVAVTDKLTVFISIVLCLK